MVAKNLCTSCKKQISNIPRSTIFKCPNCGKQEILRCGKCRQLATAYTCAQCKFEGPN